MKTNNTVSRKFHRRFAALALFTLALFQACSEATNTPINPTATPTTLASTATLLTTPTSLAPTATPKPLAKDYFIVPYTADVSQIADKDFSVGDTLTVNWLVDNKTGSIFVGNNGMPPTKLLVTIYGPYLTVEELKTVPRKSPVIITKVIDPSQEFMNGSPLSTGLKLPPNAKSGFYELEWSVEIGNYQASASTVFTVK